MALRGLLDELGLDVIARSEGVLAIPYPLADGETPAILASEDGDTVLLHAFIHAQAPTPLPSALSNYLLKRNHDRHLGRYAIWHDGEIVFQVDLPTAQLRAPQLKFALAVIRQEAREVWREVRNLCGDAATDDHPTTDPEPIRPWFRG